MPKSWNPSIMPLKQEFPKKAFAYSFLQNRQRIGTPRAACKANFFSRLNQHPSQEKNKMLGPSKGGPFGRAAVQRGVLLAATSESINVKKKP